MKYLKPLFPKEILLDTTILISILFIEIGLLFWLNLYFSISLSSDLIIF